MIQDMLELRILVRGEVLKHGDLEQRFKGRNNMGPDLVERG